MNKSLIVPALVLALGACDTLRSLNTPDNRDIAVQASLAAIEALNKGGFDPLKLDDGQVAMAAVACSVAANYLSTQVDDEAERAEIVALGEDICRVVGVALAPAPVEAPEPPAPSQEA